MSWRIIAISNPAKLSVKQKQLFIEQKETVSVPLEDISVLLLDSYGIQMSNHFLTETAKEKITTIICNEKHLPIAQILSYQSHSRQLKVLQSQINLPEPFKKRVWQLVIKQKIQNQGKVLQKLAKDDTISDLALTVKSGDSDNREAYASRLYFAKLLGKGITRKTEHRLNAAMNYGYALVRAHIARILSSYGFATSLGIHHKNEVNNYNLADDFIEPYRPIVDFYVYSMVLHSPDEGDILTSLDKQKILDIFNYGCFIRGKKYRLDFAVEMTIQSFSSACVDKVFENILLPDINLRLCKGL